MTEDIQNCADYQKILSNYWWAVTMEYEHPASVYLAMLRDFEKNKKSSATNQVAK